MRAEGQYSVIYNNATHRTEEDFIGFQQKITAQIVFGTLTKFQCTDGNGVKGHTCLEFEWDKKERTPQKQVSSAGTAVIPEI